MAQFSFSCSYLHSVTLLTFDKLHTIFTRLLVTVGLTLMPPKVGVAVPMPVMPSMFCNDPTFR